MFVSIDAERDLTNPIPLHDKNLQQGKNKKELPQRDKGQLIL